MKLDRTNQWLLATALILLAATALRIAQTNRGPALPWSIEAFNEPEVKAIRYTTAEGTLLIERTEDRWVLREPGEVPANSQKVETLLRDWADGFTPDVRLAADPSAEELATYGLDQGQRETLLIEGNARTLVALQVGKKIAGGSNYVRRQGDDAVFRGRVPGGFRLKVDADEWRDKRLFPFTKDDIASLAVRNSHGSFRFQRTETERRAFWTAEEPADFPVSSRVLDSMGRALANLTARQILEGADAEAVRGGAGLDQPVVELSVRTESGLERRAFYGGAAEAEGSVYAAIEGDDRIFVVPASTLGQFDKSAADLRDRTVVRFERSPEARVRFVRGDRVAVVAAVGERDWAVVEPAGLAVQPDAVSLAANSLLNLQATEVFDGPDAPDAGTGVESPVIEIIAGGETQRVRIGAGPTDGRYLVQVDGRTEVFALRAAVIDRLLALTPATQ